MTDSLVVKYITVFVLGMFKFLLAPAFGAMTNLEVLPTALLSVAGMMSTVVALTFSGEQFRNYLLRRFFKNRKLFSKRNRQIVRIWRKWGIKGVALLTPIFFSPTIGTMIAVSFGEKKERIVFFMFVFAVFWASVLSVAFVFGGRELAQSFS